MRHDLGAVMGKPDNKQAKINFEKRTTRLQDMGLTPVTVVPETQLEPEQEDDIQTMLREVKVCLQEIDPKLNSLALQMDHVSQNVDKHKSHIDTLETRVSDSDDHQVETHERLLRMDKVLEVIKARNEDLEVRSRRNNVRITGIPESINIENMKHYIEGLLRDLFGSGLSEMFLVERAHCTLGPRPPLAPSRSRYWLVF